MKKILILAILSLFLFACQSDRFDTNDIIKKIELKVYSVIEGEKSLTDYRLQEVNKDNEIIKETVYNLLDQSLIYEMTEKEYNQYGDVIHSMTHQNDILLYETIHKYKKDKKISSETFREGVLTYTETYEYDGPVKTVSIKTDTMTQVSTYTTLDDGSTSLKTEADFDSETFSFEGTIDDQDRLIFFTKLIDGDLETSHVVYDDKTFTKTITSSDGSKEYISQIERKDKHGNVLEILTFSPSGSSQMSWSYDYTYNDKGDWTIKNQYIDGVLTSVEERFITY